jgi:hypothetical protein
MEWLDNTVFKITSKDKPAVIAKLFNEAANAQVVLIVGLDSLPRLSITTLKPPCKETADANCFILPRSVSMLPSSDPLITMIV